MGILTTLRDRVEENFIGQHEYKKVLYDLIHCQLLNGFSGLDLKYFTPNMLVMGPTGTGKTSIPKFIAQEVGIPFLYISGPLLSIPGWKGEDINEYINNHVRECQSMNLMYEQTIVFIDEFDKISQSRDAQHADHSLEVLNSLLTLIEGGVTSVTEKLGSRQTGGYDVSGFIWIFAGVFDTDKIQTSNNIGFLHQKKRSNAADNAVIKVVEKFNIPKEFLGRIQIFTNTKKLSDDELTRVIDLKIKQIANEFYAIAEIYDIDFNIDDYIDRDELVDYCKEYDYGIRMINSIIFNRLLKVLELCDDEVLTVLIEKSNIEEEERL